MGCAVTNFTNREISYTHFSFSLLLSPCLRIIGAEKAVCSPDVVASTSSQFRCKGLHYLLATMLNNCSVGPFALFDFVSTFHLFLSLRVGILGFSREERAKQGRGILIPFTLLAHLP